MLSVGGRNEATKTLFSFVCKDKPLSYSVSWLYNSRTVLWPRRSVVSPLQSNMPCKLGLVPHLDFFSSCAVAPVAPRAWGDDTPSALPSPPSVRPIYTATYANFLGSLRLGLVSRWPLATDHVFGGSAAVWGYYGILPIQREHRRWRTCHWG